ncbi:Uncharacterised protein [Shigella sonnei]|nr:Uncharacterised protein [Shigella sonnei]
MVAITEPPVASIGSTISAIRSSMLETSFWKYGTGSSVSSLRYIPTTLMRALGTFSSTPSIIPRPARRIGTTVIFLPLIWSISTGPFQPSIVTFSVSRSAVAS